MKVLCLEAQTPSSRVMHGKLRCGFPWTGVGLALAKEWHHMTSLGSGAVRSYQLSHCYKECTPTPGREAREFHNLFLDK